jgi:serine/threonine protein kinase
MRLNKPSVSYKVEREVGRGTRGVVYLGHAETDPTQFVAMKHLGNFANTAELDRFKRRLDAMRYLEHPNLLPILDVVDIEGGIVVVTPFVNGGSLLERARGSLNPADVVSIISQIAGALALLNSRAIVHRNVKASNIVFDGDHPFLTDVGHDPQSNQPSTTNTTYSLDELSYLDPAVGDVFDESALTDQYALGVVAYFAITGHFPFRGASPQAVLRAASVGDFAPIDERCGPVGDVIQRAFHHEPGLRFDSLQQFASALCNPADFVPSSQKQGAANSTSSIRSVPFDKTRQSPPNDHAVPSKTDGLSLHTDLLPADHTIQTTSVRQPTSTRTMRGSSDTSPDGTRTDEDTYADDTHKRVRIRRNRILGVAVASTAAILLGVLTINRKQGDPVSTLLARPLPTCEAVTYQCVKSVIRDARGLSVTFADQTRLDFAVGRPDDIIRVDNWFCGDRATPAIYRPSTGVIYYANNWPSATGMPTKLLADATGIRNAIVRAGDHNNDGCADLALDRGDKRTWILTAMSANRLQPVASLAG